MTALDELNDVPLTKPNPNCHHPDCWYLEWRQTPINLTNSLAESPRRSVSAVEHNNRVQNSQIIHSFDEQGRPVQKYPTMRYQQRVKRRWLPLPDVGEGRYTTYETEQLVCVPFKIGNIDHQKISLLSEYAQITEQDIFLHALERWYARRISTPINHPPSEPPPPLTPEEERIVKNLLSK